MTQAHPDSALNDAQALLAARTLLDAEARTGELSGHVSEPDVLPVATPAVTPAHGVGSPDGHAGSPRQRRYPVTLSGSAADLEGLVAALLRETEVQAANEQYARVSELADELREVLGSAPSEVLAQALNHQAMALFLQGSYREASAVTEEEAAVRAALHDHAGHAKCLNNLGLIHIELGDLPTALGHLMRCYEYIHQCPAPLEALASSCQINIGNIHQLMGNLAKATESFQEGVGAARRVGHTAHEIAGLTGIGMVAKDCGHHTEALEVLASALVLAQTNARRHDEAEILDALGQVYAGMSQRQLALDTFAQALAIAEELGALPSQQNALFNLARLHVGTEPTQAVHHFEAALALAQQSGSEGAALEIHEALGAALEQLGHFESAAQQFRAALSLERSLRNREGQQHLLKLTAQLDVERARHQAETYRLMTEAAQRARGEAEELVRNRTAALEQAQREIITRLGIAGEYRDDKTGEHTQRVSQFAAALAAAIGLPDEDVKLIQLASRLHDIGKIGVPDGVLLKAGRLTADEFEVMKQHTVIGARVLEGGQSALMLMAEEIARTHHERWDGSGYPAGLRGESIPLAGRIVAIVDVWDALTTSRSYKEAWAARDAVREMAAHSGQHFDPELLTVFLNMITGVLDTEDVAET